MGGEIGDESGNNKLSRPRKGKRNTRLKRDEEELQSAAVGAAKSLPGDWTRIAEELMSRLTIQESYTELEDVDKEQSAVSSSRLSTMKVTKSFESTKGRNWIRGSQRQPERFSFVYSQPPLGIFNARKLKSNAARGVMEENDDLWHVVSMEKIKRESGGLPRNGFEELIQWTKEGRIWTFPIDNEEDMHEERQYEFHQHVFLHQYLRDFPTEGPLRRFMDLVVVGLSKNPWISVPEKVEHIRWYADYFRQKQQLLESSIGERAKMK